MTVPVSPVPAVPPALTESGPGQREVGEELPLAVSRPALVLLLVAAALLAWASRMAFSPALLALSGLFVAEVAVALSLTRAAAASHPTRSTVAAVASLLLVALAAKGALHGFGDMAFVAGLFVIAAIIPTLLLLGAVALVLRRRTPRSLADESLRAASLVRLGAIVAVLAGGIQAHRTYSAVPDAVAALGIALLTATYALHVVKRTGRASS